MLSNIITDLILQCQVQSITAKSSDAGCCSVNIVTGVFKQFTSLAFHDLGLLLIAAV
jgi:hypothetical protein